MKCEMCHKSEATVAYTHIVENEKKTVNLCSSCTPQQKVQVAAKAQAEAGPPGMVKKVKAELKQMPKTEGTTIAQCSGCGTTYDEFRKSGRFGCHQCYEAFGDHLERLMKRIHGAVVHQGKGQIEQRELVQPEEELKGLRQDLAAAVTDEAYEKAATLRDRILELEAEIGSEADE
ncbi:MAG: hypothetical protein HOC74_00830 [Gemmatimonadetes bacterium]|nr:hypothetical protein [Gemmatimonadota bacterium]